MEGPGRVARWAGGVVALGVLLAPGCKPQVATDLPICKSEVAGSEAEEVAAGQIPADIWYLIVLRNYNRATSEVQRPVQDCSGRPVEGSVADPRIAACLQAGMGGSPLPPRALTEDDLVVVPTSDGRQLVWAKTTYFDTGEALGPVAIAEWTSRGVAIRAIGTLRAHAQKAALRLEPMGNAQVLVVESRVCDPDDPRKCHRVLRLLPLLGDAFVETPLLAEDGSCLGVASFQLHKEQEVRLGNGMQRRFEMATSVDFTDGQVIVTEQVDIEDSDPAQPDAPAKSFRKANIQRPLRLASGGVVTKPGLWETMLREHGSVRVEE